MVDDFAFYTVLTIAIVAISLLIIIFLVIKKMMPHPLMMKVLSTLHACLFGYENALVELIGPRGYKTHVFPKIIETIAKLKGEDQLIDAVVNAKIPKEAMEKWINVLKLAGVSKDAYLEENTDNSFIIHIPHCTMCNPIHSIMGKEIKGICPMALIIAGAGNFVKNDKNTVLEYSHLTPTGTSTVLKFESLDSES